MTAKPLHNVRRTMHLAAASILILDGDILIWRRGNRLYQRIIAAVGRSEYSHVEMAAWIDRELYGVGMIAFHGGRKERLACQVSRWPGRIDWYSASDEFNGTWFNRRAAVVKMLDFVGRRYGWRAILRLSLRRLPGIRLFAKPLPDDYYHSHPPFCSDAISEADMASNIDPVPNLACCLTEPGDLARSLFYTFQASLVL